MLLDLQRALAACLLDGRDSAPIRGGKLPVLRRLEIYRHNVYSNLRGALKDIYPVVLSVVGEAFFHTAADACIAVYPSRGGDLNQFGGHWAAFLASYPHAASLPYLADVARLEWAWHQAFHASDAPPFDFARLADIPADEHGKLGFLLHPTVGLVRSEYPLLRIWQVNQAHYQGEMAVDWQVGGDFLIVRRDELNNVVIASIANAEFAFLDALSRHANLEDATASARAVDSAFDLPACLIRAVQSGLIAAIAA